MSDYSRTVDFAAKDALLTGDSNKLVVGTELGTEFDNIVTAVATKFDSASLSTFGKSLVDDAAASNARTTLGLGSSSVVDTGTATGKVPLVGTKSSTVTLAGLVERSTSAENVTGTDDTVHPTVAGTKEMIDTHAPSSGISNVVEDTTPQLGGDLDGQDKTVSKVNLLDTGVVTNAIGAIGGGSQSIDLTLGNSVVATVDTSETTFTFDNPTASDEMCGFILLLTNGGSQTVNWPASVDWAGGIAPTLTTAGLDILVFITANGGSLWHGVVSSLDSK